jgi:Uma2 family endonuclease
MGRFDIQWLLTLNNRMNAIMPAPKKRVLTVNDYLETPDGPPWYQLIDGQLLLEPSPTWTHQSVSSELEHALKVYLKINPLGALFSAPLDVYLDETNVFQPDIGVIMNAHRHLITERGVRGAPDFIVEILSPSNHRLDRGPKRRKYAEAGVREMWLVDPVKQTIEAYLFDQNTGQPRHTWHRDDTLTSMLFPGLSIAANEIFA